MAKFGLLDDANDCSDASNAAVAEDVNPIKFRLFISWPTVGLLSNILVK
jgi:hypothetical protein